MNSSTAINDDGGSIMSENCAGINKYLLNLKERMQEWGPFGELENKILTFSIGNPNEGHGPVLPRDIDDRIAKYVAVIVSNGIGAKYCAHIPYCTDRLGDIAKEWSPEYIPVKELAEKTISFIKYYLKLLNSPALDKVAIITGHIGNSIIEKYLPQIQKGLGAMQVVCTPGILVYPEQFPNFSEFFPIAFGHADTVEHSIAAALSLVDFDKLRMMNVKIKEDFPEALRLWPPIGGLGGYLYFGGARFKELKNKKYGLLNCFEQFKKDGEIKAIPKLGKMILRYSIKNVQNVILAAPEETR